MSYIDHAYYKNTFKGKDIPVGEFDRLADIASDLMDSIVQRPIDSVMAESAEVKKATAYQVEMLNEHNGVDAVVGTSEIGGSISVGGYTVTSPSVSKLLSKDGIAISSLALNQLRKAGLMCRWAGYERWLEEQNE